MKLVAAISAFLFIALAAIFGVNVSADQAAPWPTFLSISLFVAATSLVLGIAFGRPAMWVTTLSGGLALFILWLPLQYYATEESLIRSAMALLCIVLAQAPLFIVGGLLRTRIAARMCGP
ncbi:hypothetical protein [Massilia niastensis]|uniref:hypothetical protein n=1 Tax=Massilia niastensis TaxID=544911 RepID=UPI0003653E30|nr:hypothetical protein [Massilia niastensis]